MLRKSVIILEIVALLVGISIDIFYTNIFFNRGGGYEAHTPEVQVDGKCEDAIKYYKQYMMAKSDEDKQIIKNLVAIEYATFDTDYLEAGEVKDFIYNCKNNPSLELD